MHRQLSTAIAFLVCTSIAAPIFAQEETKPDPKSATTNTWQLETLKLKNGRTLRGLLQSRRAGEVEFVEIVRQPGKAMFAVLHPIPAAQVESLTLLPKKEHQALQRRFDQFRHRASIEAGRMESLALAEEERDGRRFLVYRGPWFTLLSTADDETTRRCVVRIEQTFRAYRLLLTPRSTESRNLQVVVWGSMDEYRTALRAERLEIANPAYYSVTKNQIVAGSDLSQYAAELAKARAKNERARQEHVALDELLPLRLAILAEEMQRKGFTKDEIKDEITLRRSAWKDELAAQEKQIAEMSRRNEAKFAEVTREMFRRLSHEAFHAYVENYVYPHDAGELPRWLNEGLAQIFEHGQLEADALRVDAPHRELLLRLQEDLAGDDPLPMSQLLTADANSFVKTHQAAASNRSYLYAWGLAYYLTFEHDLLRSDRLDEYAATSKSPDRVQRFEKLAGEPLEQFEAKWRATMLKLKAPR